MAKMAWISRPANRIGEMKRRELRKLAGSWTSLFRHKDKLTMDECLFIIWDELFRDPCRWSTHVVRVYGWYSQKRKTREMDQIRERAKYAKADEGERRGGLVSSSDTSAQDEMLRDAIRREPEHDIFDLL